MINLSKIIINVSSRNLESGLENFNPQERDSIMLPNIKCQYEKQANIQANTK